MSGAAAKAGPVVIDAGGFDALIAALAAEGREVLGPVKRDGAIVYDAISGQGDLPKGWVDEQSGGHYRLSREGEAYFGATLGPQGWKRVLHPPQQRLWRTEGTGENTGIIAEPLDTAKRAFIGVRACDLAAIAVQDKVLTEGLYKDPHYAARRENLFIVAVNCTRSAATCFCTSMGTGPKADKGYDIALTELEGGRFLAEAGSAAGEARLAALPSAPATDAQAREAEAGIAQAAAQQRRIDTDGLPELLKERPDHPRWSEVAQRCLNCANCTLVCPTCFCTTTDEVTALDGPETERVNRWGSCFTMDFSHVHGGAVRKGAKSRYRQWMTHKLGTWVDQFGEMGCVGCGRCISWCPVGIDITEEAAALRGSGG
ncbi:4Fe-4S dicluster domain-containing protein [Sinisalibacter aestuarii]|uniref:4Fe-4S ferredoxin n=1 Tax=Sinisalibacter aestuarii TaxID=2949426 RepID=A0ABQ5LQM1_9RHOB|nr:4Fe-4S dicluster domain-containing protein [Sinisalibacter aestuarii]GKY87305.1 4Fe-4S ferredoxin [Sinisalibacter aestuarii]